MTRLGTHIVLSTAHLTEEVSGMLDEMGEDKDAPNPYGDWRRHVRVRCGFAYGHWIKAGQTNPDETPEELAARREELPQCLLDCLDHAATYNASWILFDRDEEPVHGALPEHQW